MKTLDEISTEFANFTYEKDAKIIEDKIRKMIKFVETAAIETKKVSVSKKGPTYGNPSSLHHRGVWGYPQVFVAGEGVKKPVQVKHRCTFAPFQTFIKCRPRDRTYGYDVDMGDPAVPDFFTSLDEWRMFRGQHHTQDFGVWLAENCPALHDLDQRVRAAWDKQVGVFPKEADRYVDKLGGRQRVNFQNKLAREFGKYKGDLMHMPPRLIYEIFQFSRDHSPAMNSLLNFCRKNQDDAMFIDESDVETALKLAQVIGVMKE